MIFFDFCVAKAFPPLKKTLILFLYAPKLLSQSFTKRTKTYPAYCVPKIYSPISTSLFPRIAESLDGSKLSVKHIKEKGIKGVLKKKSKEMFGKPRNSGNYSILALKSLEESKLLCGENYN